MLALARVSSVPGYVFKEYRENYNEILTSTINDVKRLALYSGQKNQIYKRDRSRRKNYFHENMVRFIDIALSFSPYIPYKYAICFISSALTLLDRR